MSENRSSSYLEKQLAAKRRKKVAAVVQYTLAIIITLCVMFPLYWMIVSSFKSQEEILLLKPTLWPKEWHPENYAIVFKRANFAKYYYNTIVMTAGILISQIVTGTLAAYGFSKGKFRGQNALFMFVLGALMIPIQVTFIPLYIMCANWGLIDTFLGLILPECVSAYYIFMLRQNFMAVDDSYVDAAKVDGLGRIGIITKILMPMCKSSLVTTILVTFTNGWNSYFWPKIIAKNETRRVLTIGLAQLKNTFAGQATMNNHEIMAGAVMAILPVVILFFVFQKYMLTGYSKAAMK